MAVTINKDNVHSLVGSELGVSGWIRIEQPRIDAFADTTEDHQFIHVDPERAAATPFGGTIAHGFLTLSLLPRMMEDIGGGMEDAVMGLNYGFDKIRFLAPVKVNSRVRARAKLLGVREKAPKQFLVTQEITV
jgi:acyl dehydratase